MMHTRFLKILLLLIGGAFSRLDSYSQTSREWIGAGTSWTTSTNWTGGMVPNNVRVEFKGLGNATSNNNQSSLITYKRLYFSSANGTKAYTITGNQITLVDNSTGGFGMVQNASTSLQTITATPIIFNDNARSAVISTTSTGALSLKGITLGTNLSLLKIYGENTASTITFTGGISGSRQIIIGPNESGDLKSNTRAIFAFDNSAFTGAINIESGSLNLRATNSDGISAGNYITVENNAALEVQGGITLSGKKIILNGTGISSNGALRNVSGTNTISSNICLSNSSTITNASGTLNLGNIGKYDGALDWNLTFAGTGAINVSGVIGQSTGLLTLGGLTKNGTGLLTITGLCNYTGGTVLGTSALLQLGNNDVLPLGTSLSLQNNAELRTAGKNQQFGVLRLLGNTVANTSTIVMDSTVNHTIRFASSRDESWNALKTLNITKWKGSYTGASANAGKIYFTPVDASTPGLTDQQLSQIKMGTFVQGAELLATGELVPSKKPIILSMKGSNIGNTGNGTPLNSSGYVGSTITLTGGNFSLGGLLVYVGGSLVSPTLVNDATITFKLGHGDAGQVKVVTNGGERIYSNNLVNLGYATGNSGNWDLGATWLNTTVPLGNQKITIAHANVKANMLVPDLNPVLPATNPLTIFPNSSLLLTADSLLPSTVPLILAGGTLRAFNSTTDTTTILDGNNQRFGSLTVSANSKIALGIKVGNVMKFEASSLNAWGAGANLEIVNWQGLPEASGTATKIYVGNDSTGLTADQLRSIRFLPLCNGAKLLADGELVPSIAPFISTVHSDLNAQPFTYAAYIGTTVTIDGCQMKDVHTVKVGGLSIPFDTVHFDLSSDLFGYEIQFTYNSNISDGAIELISPLKSGVSPSSLIGMGFISQANGVWSDTLSWLSDSLPIAGKKVTIQNELVIDTKNLPQITGLELKSGGLLTFSDSTTLTVNGSVVNAGTIQPAIGSYLKIGSGGTLTNNGTFSSGDLGTVEFLGSGTINGSNTITFYNLIMNSGSLVFPQVSSTPHPTVTGEFRINGGTVPYSNNNSNIGPRYGNTSRLVYASGTTQSRTAEWRGLAGTSQGQNNPGYPHDVWVINGTTLSLDGPKPYNANDHTDKLVMAGDLKVIDGTVKNDLDRPLEIRESLILGESETSTGTFLMGDPAVSGMEDYIYNYIAIDEDLSIYKNSTFNPQSNTKPIYFEGLTDGNISHPGYIGTPPALQLNKIAVNKNGNLTLNTPVQILEDIIFTSGIVNSTADNILSLGLDAIWEDASSLSFVNGPMKKVTGISIVTASLDAEFEFPIGKTIGTENYYKPVKVADMQHNGETDYSAEYFSAPTVNTLDFQEQDFLDEILHGVWGSEYWVVNRLNGTGQSRVAIPYVTGNSWTYSGPCLTCKVGVVRYNGISWEFTENPGGFSNSGPYIMAMKNDSSGWVHSSILNNFSPFTIGWGLEEVLPIKLLYFTGSLAGNDVLLKWKIADSKDLKYFIVEHGTDGRNFAALGKVQWEENKEFGWRHVGPGPGVHYYRLQMVEKSGEKAYSRVEMVQIGVSRTIIEGLVQNPVYGGRAILNIYSAKSQSAEAAVFDMSGRLVFRQQFSLAAGKNNPALSLLPLASGQYRMLIRTADGVEKTIALVK